MTRTSDEEIRIAPFAPEHLAAIAPGPFDAVAVEGFDLRAMAEARVQLGPAWSALSGARVLGCAGIVPLWRGVGAAWLLGGDELRRHPLALHRAVARGLPRAMRGLGLRRLQISVHENFAASLRWVERLGFRHEGAMPAYGPNGDTYIRYARIIDDRR
jgi:RimJ/RimL family protein N-acetyltransferase